MQHGPRVECKEKVRRVIIIILLRDVRSHTGRYL